MLGDIDSEQVALTEHEQQPWHHHPYWQVARRDLIGPLSGAQHCELSEQRAEPGGYVPIHHHDVEEIITVVSGTLSVMVGGQYFEMPASTSVVIPPGVEHGWRNKSQSSAIFLVYFPALDPASHWREPKSKI
ncbi:cupin domain-containing protein (plasmid) [Deinococcus taeanensis]|uniref:cupin domain-containing protein n=1 Tax=Deinococcus taeanensis TaxID=2737050 RepID=UPI001CDC9E2E|nr:cupin domain-containing protein [Deinococcus taeanensis]UBV44179.1 cupin domain-containing protein [Deinococcus taeanensis]